MTYTLNQLQALKLPGTNGALMYDPYTERVVELDDKQPGGVFAYHPQEFYVLPQDGWKHLSGCVCLDCQR